MKNLLNQYHLYYKLIAILLFCIACAVTPKNEKSPSFVVTKTPKQDLAKEIYYLSDLNSLESIFQFKNHVNNKMYSEEIVSNMFQYYYSNLRFREWSINFLNKNLSQFEMEQLKQKFQSVEFKQIKNAISKTQFQEKEYQIFLKDFKQTENNTERAETIARILNITKIVNMTKTIVSEVTMALKRSHYFIEQDTYPSVNVLLKLKDLEKKEEEKNKKDYNQVFEEMQMTLMYSFQKMSNDQLYQIHNFFNQESVKNLNLRFNLALAAHLRETRLDFTRELIIYMSEKYSDRLPAALSTFKDKNRNTNPKK